MSEVAIKLARISVMLDNIDLEHTGVSRLRDQLDHINDSLQDVIGMIHADLDGVDLEDDAQGAN